MPERVGRYRQLYQPRANVPALYTVIVRWPSCTRSDTPAELYGCYSYGIPYARELSTAAMNCQAIHCATVDGCYLRLIAP